MHDAHDLEVLLRSRTPLIAIETLEEERVLDLCKKPAINLQRPLFRWTITEGLQRWDVLLPPQRHNSKPVELLNQIKSTPTGGIYVLLDFHPYLDDPVHVRLLKDIAVNHDDVPHTVVLVSHELQIPAELERFCARFQLSIPDRQLLERVIREEARRYAHGRPKERMSTDRQTLDRVVENLLGLPESDARRLARHAIEDDGALTEADVPVIAQAKFELLGKGGVLSFEYDTARFADVGGLQRLKEWIKLRKNAFAQPAAAPAGLDPPKGILLLGVQGCGKSLVAKAVAGALAAPLLRLDFGTLYNKFYGQTEQNLRDSLRTAEVMEPCVLWIDEIEKGVSIEQNDSGTSQRILGTLLTWMAEKKQRVFIVATSNDIEALPPELMRKGRLDEIFFVDLPDAGVRADIFAIHLNRRGLDANRFALGGLADASAGFSGAEIEQVVVSSMYSAHAQGGELRTEHLLEEIAATRPLSVVMAERIGHLRKWGRERTVPAH